MKIVILGNSAAGVKIIEEVRQGDSSSEITIISFDGHYPNKRDAFAAFIGKEISPEDVFCRPKDFYEKNNINILFDKKISRINFKRKKIFTDDKEQIDYDVLIVTDTPENRFPDIKGTNKGNIFGYKKLNDIDKIVNALPIVKTVIIQSDSFSGLQAAVSFVKRKKEVILASSRNDFFSKHFEAGAIEWLLSKFEEKGLRIMRENTISEILGDKEAKAVRLNKEKVFAAEVILFMEADEDLRLFSGSGIQMGQKIDVDQDFRAKGADDLFVVDQSCEWAGEEPVTPLAVLEEQGKKVASAISGQDHGLVLPVYSQSLNVEGISITLLGQTREKEGVTVKRMFSPESGQYKGFYIEGDCLVGAVLINAEDEKEEFLRQINEKVTFQWTPPDVPQGSEELSGGDSCLQEVDGENVSTELVDN